MGFWGFGVLGFWGDAPKHKGISVLVIPTDLPGVVRRPFPSICGIDDLDFNEVFLTDVRVPAENLVGPLNGGWGVANGSLGHERTMMWLGFADRIHNVLGDFRPRTPLERDQFASGVMDYHALRLMGSRGLAKAARGETDVAGVSVVKLFGSEAYANIANQGMQIMGGYGYIMEFDMQRHYRDARATTITAGTSQMQRNLIAGLMGLKTK